MPPRKRTPAAEDIKAAPGAPADPEDEQQKSEDPKDDQGGPERSDLQAVERPCPECMPNGWPEGAFAVGCTHGTWIRDNT
ncbi:hypothetical protein ACIQ9J_01360 [Streptomyces sp. NPDC094153]|uniref:hypothetical protein n=1 Tax=Streptomyces sp. NPDC094153 TaxID=3366058 RepID=UPI0038264BAC